MKPIVTPRNTLQRRATIYPDASPHSYSASHHECTGLLWCEALQFPLFQLRENGRLGKIHHGPEETHDADFELVDWMIDSEVLQTLLDSTK